MHRQRYVLFHCNKIKLVILWFCIFLCCKALTQNIFNSKLNIQRKQKCIISCDINFWHIWMPLLGILRYCVMKPVGTQFKILKLIDFKKQVIVIEVCKNVLSPLIKGQSVHYSTKSILPGWKCSKDKWLERSKQTFRIVFHLGLIQ